MGFFHSDMKNKLPLRGRKKLPLRSRKFKRLQLLKQFKPGRVYTFVPFSELDELPDDTLLWADEPQKETCCGDC